MSGKDSSSIQDIFVRIEAAFQRKFPKISRVEMADRISEQGERCSVRTLIGYAAGENWPHIRILKAISIVTDTSLDEIVFGIPRGRIADNIDKAVLMLKGAYSEILDGVQLTERKVTPTLIELRKAINELSDQDLELTLENVRRLHVK